MLAGKYYIGDLSLIFKSEWNDILKLFNSSKSNEFTILNGSTIACYKTNNGNESYFDQFGQKYIISKSIIGCIKIEDIDNIEADFSNGQIVSFYDEFKTWESLGRILFGHICVDTN